LKAAIDDLREALDDNSSTLPKLEGLATKVLNVSNELNIIDDEILNLIDPQDVEEDVLQSAQYLDPTFELLAAITNECEILRAGSSNYRWKWS